MAFYVIFLVFFFKKLKNTGFFFLVKINLIRCEKLKAPF
jgi:hypothetical protein